MVPRTSTPVLHRPTSLPRPVAHRAVVSAPNLRVARGFPNQGPGTGARDFARSVDWIHREIPGSVEVMPKTETAGLAAQAHPIHYRLSKVDECPFPWLDHLFCDASSRTHCRTQIG
jgi:hypothetical protein